MEYEFRNPKRIAANLIDMEINHPALGWIPYTAMKDDDDTGAMFSAAFAQVDGDVQHVDLPADRSAAAMEKIDLLMALVEMGIATEDEAAAAMNGDPPPAFMPYVEAMPTKDRLRYRLEWASGGKIARLDRVLVAVAAARFGSSAEKILDRAFGIGG